MARRQHLAITVALVFAIFFGITYLFSTPAPLPVLESHVVDTSAAHADAAPDVHAVAGDGVAVPVEKAESTSEEKKFAIDLDAVPEALFDGDSIMPKLENATLKAELGRATWKFLHTMVSRFPEKPTPEERTTLNTFFHLFGRLYPCGDCARHFRKLLAEFEPQTSSRNAAAGWLCFVHNQVNERLEKEIFDCNNIGDFYDCGCGEEKKEGEGEGDELKPREKGEDASEEDGDCEACKAD